MAKYRKKPVVIEAIKWRGNNYSQMFKFLGEYSCNIHNPYLDALKFEHFYFDYNKVKGGLIIKTLEGEHIATIGDFIIKSVNNEYYPCKPDIFEKTYEKV